MRSYIEVIGFRELSPLGGTAKDLMLGTTSQKLGSCGGDIQGSTLIERPTSVTAILT